jgi:hypothetical protein
MEITSSKITIYDSNTNTIFKVEFIKEDGIVIGTDINVRIDKRKEEVPNYIRNKIDDISKALFNEAPFIFYYEVEL